MIEINTLADFSRNNCVSICAFLVPANIITTIGTLYYLYRGRSTRELLPVGAIACILALVMFLHVGTWFTIGVVMAPTFILLGLGLTCLVINIKALTDTEKMSLLLRSGWQYTARLLN